MKTTIIAAAAITLAIPAVPALAGSHGGNGGNGMNGQVPGAHFIENFDGNGDGKVTLEEIRAKRAEIFYMVDQNEDGVLDSAEYDLFDETRAADHEGQGCAHGGQGNGQGKRGEGMTREFNDLDGDGKVSEAEFLKAADAWFAMKDRNGDGVITTADFGPGHN